MKFIVIGITDNPQPQFSAELREIIRKGKVFSGGKRHHAIVAPLLPEAAVWIDITAPLEAVFDRYKILDSNFNSQIIVFASGDPLFFGFANTIRRKMPEAEIKVYPSFNTLQMLAHRLVMPYHDTHIVSLTGRPWNEFDHALIEGKSKIGVLTDGEHTPAIIASRMLRYGYTCYRMHIGEHLGNPNKERVTTVSLEEAAQGEFSSPNCLILTGSHQRRFGIPDGEFALLDHRERMITKMPIRLLTLQALDLPQRRVLWDIGFCTGSVSIEARLQFPHLHIEAFEIRPEGQQLMEVNSRRFGAPGIEVHIGDFLATDISSLPSPDAVFIGGHGGQLKEIMRRVVKSQESRVESREACCIVMNSVNMVSRQLWDEACAELGLQQEPPLRFQVNDYNPIEILKCRT